MKTLLNPLLRLLIGLFGISFLWLSAEKIAADWSLRLESRQTHGVVIKIIHQVAFGSQRLIEYRDGTGETHRFINLSYYHGRFGPGEGKEVPVRYSLTQPQTAVIDTFWGRYGTTAEFLLLGLFGVVSALLPPKKHSRS